MSDPTTEMRPRVNLLIPKSWDTVTITIVHCDKMTKQQISEILIKLGNKLIAGDPDGPTS